MPSAQPADAPMLEHALAYLADGYPVFPVCSPRFGTHTHGQARCANPGKTPLVPWAPLQERLPTETEVRVWWARWPTANIGMATGILSGVLVLDADGGDARAACLQRGGLDRTPTVWTGKVGGAHFHLAYPGGDVRNFARKLPGTDLRAQGGYVLLPPSVHASGNLYRWAEHTRELPLAPTPPWLLELTREREPSSDAWEPSEGISIDEAVAGFELGGRDTGLFKFACRLRHDDVPFDAAAALMLASARSCRPPFGDAEALAKLRYVYEKYEPGGAGPEVEHDGWFRESGPAPPLEPHSGTPYDSFFRPISELLAMPEVEPDWLVDQLFTVGSNGWVAAEPKVGKSWIVLELAYALATGSPFLGRFAVKRPRRVLYAQEEDSLQRVLRRLKQLIKGDPIRQPPSDDYFRWSIRVGFKLDNLVWLEKLRQEILAFGAEVIILDVFNRLHGSDENKQAEMTAILNNLTRLTNDYGCSFIIVHHNRKPQDGNQARGNQMMRGSGVLAGWGECSLYLKRSKEKDTIVVTPESKDCPEMDDFTVTFADQANGGVFLEIGEAAPELLLTKASQDTIEAVERITRRGIGATVQAVAIELGKDRTTVQKRLTKLAEDGYLAAEAISSTPNPTKIYTVVPQ